MAVYWRVAEVLKRKGWSRYRLVRESRLPITTVYRLAKPGALVRRIEGQTLDTLCRVLQVEPGELLERVESKPKRGKK